MTCIKVTSFILSIYIVSNYFIGNNKSNIHLSFLVLVLVLVLIGIL